MGGTMIRTFRIFCLEKTKRFPLDEAKKRLQSVKLAQIASSAPKPLSRLLSDLSTQLTNERLGELRYRSHRWELVLTGRWPARSLSVASGSPPSLPVRVSLWLRRTTPWLIIFEAGRGLAEAAARLVATALAGDPARVHPVLPDLVHWKAIRNWIEGAGDGSGLLLGGRFYGAAPAGTPVKWIALRCASGSNLALVDESFRTATGIGELLIQTPRIGSIKKNLICRIGRLGVIRVYGQEVSDGVVDALLLELEALWSFLPEVTKDR